MTTEKTILRLPGLLLLAFLAAVVGSSHVGADDTPVESESTEAGPPAAAQPEETAETESADSASFELEDLRLFEALMVVGPKDEIDRIPGSAHVIDEKALERQQYSDVHRILRQVPGINIQDEEGYGLRPNIGIRGTGVERSQKVTLLEDGVLIAPAPYSAPSAYYSPTAGRMERFEVRKGSSSIRQGPYTNGGALNYISSSIPGELAGRMHVAAGSEETGRARLRVGDSGPRLGWLFETYQLASNGFKNLDGGGDTGFALQDYLGKIRTTSGAGAKRFQALELKLSKTLQDGDETYLGLTQEDFDESPFRRYASSEGDRIETDHEQIQLSWFAQLGRRTNLTTTAYDNEFFRNWQKLERVSGTGVATILDDPGNHARELAIVRGEIDSLPGELAVRNNRRDYYSRGVQTVLGVEIGSGELTQSLEVGLRYHEDQEDRFQEEDEYQVLEGRRVWNGPGIPGSQANRIADARAWALFVQDTITWKRWGFQPGFRVEDIDLERRDYGKSDPERTGSDLTIRQNTLTEVIPGLGVTYRLDGGSSLLLGIHRGFSPPGPGSVEDVEAESSVSYELGWRFDGSGIRAEAIGFFNDYDNLLGTDTVSGGGGGTGDQFNGGAVRILGLETGFGVDLGPERWAGVSLPLQLSYTWTKSEFLTSFDTTFADWAPAVEKGDELPYVPEHQLWMGLSLLTGPWGVYLDTAYTGAMRTSSGTGPIDPSERIDDRLILDLRAEYGFLERYSVFAQILNLTDEVYVVARRPAGLRPGRPRGLMVGFTFDFGDG